MKRSITAVTKVNGKSMGPVTVQFDMGNGDTLADLSKKFGEGCLLNRFIDSLDIAVQSRIRMLLKAKKSASEIQADLNKWALPNGTARKLSDAQNMDRMAKTYVKLSDGAKAKYLAKLTA